MRLGRIRMCGKSIYLGRLINMNLKFAEVQCFVSDLMAAKKFYQEMLGLTFVAESEKYLVFDITGVEFIVMGGAKPGVLREEYGADCATVLCLETDDIYRDYQALKTNGVRFFSEIQDVPQGYFVGFQDTDGNLLELIQKRTRQ